MLYVDIVMLSGALLLIQENTAAIIDLRLSFCVNKITYVCYGCCFRKTVIILASLQFVNKLTQCL